MDKRLQGNLGECSGGENIELESNVKGVDPWKVYGVSTEMFHFFAYTASANTALRHLIGIELSFSLRLQAR
jgi:hypothetical protein